MQHPLGPLSKDAPRKFLIVVAHPGDETLCASALLRTLKNLRLIYMTNGTPLKPSASFRSEHVAFAREGLISALRVAEISAGQIDSLGIPEGECIRRLTSMTRALLERVHALEPDYIITHAYEGGHPDHDATAFATHAACAVLKTGKRRPPKLLEFGGYRGFTYELSNEEQIVKAEMLSCFRTRCKALSSSPIDHERLRIAPDYDFLDIHGAPWRNFAKNACHELSLIHHELR